MSFELLYTSAVSGLASGSRGYCTVLATEQIPHSLQRRLEAMCVYNQVFSEDYPSTPVCYSHCHLAVQEGYHVLTRISDFGADFSGRQNKLAHHVAFPVGQEPDCGPIALLKNPSVMRSHWDEVPRWTSNEPALRGTDLSPRRCSTWERMAGDAGWAGQLLQAWLSKQSTQCTIIADRAQINFALDLLDEALALLPSEIRWKATFTTYASDFPPDAECRVRFALAGSNMAKKARFIANTIDLTRALGNPPETDFASAARRGTPLRLAQPPKPTSVPVAPTPPPVHVAPPDDAELPLSPLSTTNSGTSRRQPQKQSNSFQPPRRHPEAEVTLVHHDELSNTSPFLFPIAIILGVVALVAIPTAAIVLSKSFPQKADASKPEKKDEPSSVPEEPVQDAEPSSNPQPAIPESKITHYEGTFGLDNHGMLVRLDGSELDKTNATGKLSTEFTALKLDSYAFVDSIPDVLTPTTEGNLKLKGANIASPVAIALRFQKVENPPRIIVLMFGTSSTDTPAPDQATHDDPPDSKVDQSEIRSKGNKNPTQITLPQQTIILDGSESLLIELPRTAHSDDANRVWKEVKIKEEGVEHPDLLVPDDQRPITLSSGLTVSWDSSNNNPRLKLEGAVKKETTLELLAKQFTSDGNNEIDYIMTLQAQPQAEDRARQDLVLTLAISKADILKEDDNFALKSHQASAQKFSLSLDPYFVLKPNTEKGKHQIYLFPDESRISGDVSSKDILMNLRAVRQRFLGHGVDAKGIKQRWTQYRERFTYYPQNDGISLPEFNDKVDRTSTLETISTFFNDRFKVGNHTLLDAANTAPSNLPFWAWATVDLWSDIESLQNALEKQDVLENLIGGTQIMRTSEGTKLILKVELKYDKK